jgi:nitrite reductase/ring-hydroxylating ferredoxin subunit
MPEYAKNPTRSIKPEYLVVVGICPHLGCSPSDKFQTGAQPSLPDDWQGGFLCPCHGSTFDMAGRVFKNKPATRQPRGAAAHLPVRHADPDRRRQEGLTDGAAPVQPGKASRRVKQAPTQRMAASRLEQSGEEFHEMAADKKIDTTGLGGSTSASR